MLVSRMKKANRGANVTKQTTITIIRRRKKTFIYMKQQQRQRVSGYIQRVNREKKLQIG